MTQSVLNQSPQQMLPGSEQTPGFAGTPFDIQMPAHKKQISHQAETDRALNPARVFGNLVLANSQATFKLFKQNFNHPASLVNQQNVTRCQRFRDAVRSSFVRQRSCLRLRHWSRGCVFL